MKLLDRPFAQAATLFVGATLIVCGMAWGAASTARTYDALRTHHAPTQMAESK